MNKAKILILTLFFILFLIIITQSQKYQTGIIQNIQTSKTITKITLENNPEKLIIFSNKPTNLTKKNKIKFLGNTQTYNNEKEIIVNKIIKIK